MRRQYRNATIRWECVVNADEIGTLRKRLELSKAAAARKVGVNRSTWHRWESGEIVPKGRNLQKLQKLAANRSLEERVAALETGLEELKAMIGELLGDK